MDKIFSGVQPTGDIHLGNYLGAIKQFLNFQNDADSIFCMIPASVNFLNTGNAALFTVGEGFILDTIEFNRSVSSIIILRNFSEKSSFAFELSICALPLIPANGFFTSCARVRARFAAILCEEADFDI